MENLTGKVTGRMISTARIFADAGYTAADIRRVAARRELNRPVVLELAAALDQLETLTAADQPLTLATITELSARWPVPF